MRFGRCAVCGARKPWRKLGLGNPDDWTYDQIVCRSRESCGRHWDKNEDNWRRNALGTHSFILAAGAQKHHRKAHARSARRGVYETWHPWQNNTANRPWWDE